MKPIHPSRVRCLVIGCNCTKLKVEIAPDTDWLCSRHWRTVPKQMRRHYARQASMIRKADRLDRQGVAAVLRRNRVALWMKIGAKAIEIAMGISA